MFLSKFISGAAQSYNAETQAIIDRAAVLGYPTESPTVLAACSTLIDGMKATGFWNKQDRIFIHAFTNVEWALMNAKDPSATLATRVNSCTFASKSGFEGNGGGANTMAVVMQFNPATEGVNYTLNDAGRGVWVYKAASANVRALTGSNTNASQETRNANATQHGINNASNLLNSTADLSGTGLKVINRTSASDVVLYSNKTQIVRTQTVDSIFSGSASILRAGAQYSDAGIALSFWGGAITQTQNDALVDDFTAYLTAIA